MIQVRVAPRARGDLRQIFRYGVAEFGEVAAMRYQELIATALRDIAADPLRNGVRPRPDLPGAPCCYHLRMSKGRSPPVARPRHFIVFREAGGTIEIIRVLHDAMDLGRHLPDD